MKKIKNYLYNEVGSTVFPSIVYATVNGSLLLLWK